MKNDDDDVRSLPGPVSDTASVKELRELIHDRDVLIAELRASLNEAVSRAPGDKASIRNARDDVPIAGLVVDNGWRIADVNRAATVLWGRKRKELLGADLWSLLGRGKYTYANLYRKALRENRTIDFEHFCAVLRKWLKVYASPSGRGLKLWFEDLTSQKVQIGAHALLWHQQKALADNSPDIILRFAADRTCVFANKAVERIFNVNPATIAGKQPSEMGIPDEAVHRFDRTFDVVVATRAAVTQESEMSIRGLKKHISWRVVPEHSPYVGVDSILVIGRDITAEREAEENRQALEAQLREAQKMEAVGTLSGGIAHDFNNILAVVLGNAELALDDTPDNSPLAQNLRNLRTAALRGRDLVRQILAFSKRTGHKREAVAVAPLIAETVKLLRSTIPATVALKVDTDVPRDVISANPGEIQQILMNLSTNAAHAMPGGGTVRIGLKNVVLSGRNHPVQPPLRPGEYLALAVSDTGHGMDEKTQEHIFEPFYTTRQEHGGSGLGLSVVYGIVKAYGGAVTVQSAPGKGTTFTVLLPLIDSRRTD
jgi:PAS domain S-box-containing protein